MKVMEDLVKDINADDRVRRDVLLRTTWYDVGRTGDNDILQAIFSDDVWSQDV